MAAPEDVSHAAQAEGRKLGVAAALEAVHSAQLAEQVRPYSVSVGTATMVPWRSSATAAQTPWSLVRDLGRWSARPGCWGAATAGPPALPELGSTGREQLTELNPTVALSCL